MNAPSLLPSGFYDLLPEQAMAEGRCVQTLMTAFTQAGFQPVQPPLMEFTAPDDTGDDRSFKVMDPLTQRMMTLRADMTMQVARIAAQLGGTQRLCYSGNVVRTLPDPTHRSRQLRQIGIEHFGGQDDAAILKVVADALKQTGLKRLSIDLASPALWQILSIGKDTPVAAAVKNKEIPALQELNQPLIAALCAITAPLSDAAALLTDIAMDDAARNACQQLIDLGNALEDVAVTIDPLDQPGHVSYCGISYRIYDLDSNRLVGRGGSYTNPFDGTPASGITLYSEDIIAAEEACKM